MDVTRSRIRLDSRAKPVRKALAIPNAIAAQIEKDEAMNRPLLFRSPWWRSAAQRVFVLLAAALVLTLVPVVQPPSAAASPSSTGEQETATLWSSIDAYVEHERQAARVPGIALAIVQGDRIAHLQGFGQADPSGRSVTAQTPFIIGSTSKSFTALAIMQLAEAGKLDLDAPVQRYLPWFRVADAEASARITVRHLLTHTSGIPRPVGIDSATSRDMRDGALEDHVRALSTAQLTQPVGTTWQYSNAGYMTLGLVVQAVSGQRYERYVQEHVFAPLRMASSFADPLEAQRAGLAAGYTYWFGRPVATDAPFNRQMVPAGLLISNAEDMAHYLIAQLNDGRYEDATILSPARIAELQRGAAPVPDGASGGYDPARYGMGWFVGQRSGVAVVGHPGDTATFHADMILVPESRYGIMLLMNANNRLAGERMRGVVDGVISLLHERQASTAPDTNGLDVLQVIGGLAILLGIALIWSIMRVRRYARRTPSNASVGWLSILRHIVAPQLLFLLMALVFLLGVPTLLRYPWPALLLLVPDLGTVALVSGVAALGWAVIRTVLMYPLLRRGTAPVVTSPAVAAKHIQST
jgi:CubicO group peptidase (beta-lactamase class C family)